MPRTCGPKMAGSESTLQCWRGMKDVLITSIDTQSELATADEAAKSARRTLAQE
eukprot:SAG31_NODE_2549_length_5519_cov_2.816605_7_plen_53_part_01